MDAVWEFCAMIIRLAVSILLSSVLIVTLKSVWITASINVFLVQDWVHALKTFLPQSLEVGLPVAIPVALFMHWRQYSSADAWLMMSLVASVLVVLMVSIVTGVSLQYTVYNWAKTMKAVITVSVFAMPASLIYCTLHRRKEAAEDKKLAKEIGLLK